MGSSAFLVFHVLWFSAWILSGLGFVSGISAFDPPPFGLLTIVVSLEAIFLSIFVLISQNRMSRLADRRNHLDLQINLLTEQEVTTILAMVQEIRDRIGIPPRADHGDLDQQLEKTNVHKLASELESKLPNE